MNLIHVLIESLVEEALAEEAFRATLRGTKDFRKPVSGIDPTRLPIEPEISPVGVYSASTFATGKDKGRLGLDNPRMNPDKRTAVVSIKKS